ncbi:hypothetical protein D3C72_986220 [compost metagenome]
MLVDGAQRHFLDEGDVEVTVDGEAHQIIDLMVVATFHHHAIELGVAKSRLVGRVDAFDHLRQVTGAGQFAKTLRVQAIEADVEALDPGFEQRPGQFGQLRTVGGHAQFTQAGQGGDLLAQLHHARTDQRLAPGEADLAGAQRHEALCKLINLFQGQHPLAGQKLHVLGHAIHATEIAAVGDRHPQIVHAPGESIDQDLF